MASDAYTVKDPLQMMWQFQQQQAATDQTKADTQVAQIKAAAMQQDMAVQQQNMSANQQYRDMSIQSMLQDQQGDQQAQQAQQAEQQTAQRGRALAIQQEISGPPNASKPDTPSANQQEAYQMTPVDQSVKELTARSQQVNAQYRLAAQSAAIGSPEAAAQMKTLAPIRDNIETQLRTARAEQATQNEKKAQQVAQIAGDVNSPDDLRDFVKFVRTNISPDQARKITSQLRADPQDPSQFLWGPPEQKLMKNLRDQYTTISEQQTIANQKLIREGAEASRALAEKRAATAEKQKDAELAIRQAAVGVAERKENNLEEMRSRRIQLSEQRAAKSKDPNSAEAKSTARYLSSQIGMPDDIAPKAAYDFLRQKADKIREGMDPKDADADALEYVSGMFTPGKPAEKTLGFTTKEAVPAKYGATPADNSPDLELMKKLDGSGIQAKVANGKVVGANGGPVVIKTKEQMQLLPKGTQFIGPDGKPWTAP